MRVSLMSLMCGIGLSLFASANVFAAAVLERIVGDVRASAGQGQPVAMAQGQRIESGATVITGANGQATLRFDDGQAVVLNPDSEFKGLPITSSTGIARRRITLSLSC